MSKKRLLLSLIVVCLLAAAGVAQVKYQKPPKEVLDVLNAPVTPSVSLSPTRETMLLVTPVRNPPIAEVSQPFARLAGLRIDTKTSTPHRAAGITALAVKKLADGKEVPIKLPPGKPSSPSWSPDGKSFAFTNTVPTGVQLWIGDTATATVRQVPNVTLNTALGGGGGGRGGGGGGGGFEWMPDSKSLLVRSIPAGRGRAPAAPEVPTGPNVQESAGEAEGAATFEDLLKTAHDEDLFDYYATSQLAMVNAATGVVTPLGKPGIYTMVDPSPGGKDFLVVRLHRPYSYLFTYSAFPKEVEVWDAAGKVAYKVASVPLEDKVPMNGVATGPRSYQWRSTEPATLLWTEALDNGDPKQKVPYRDRIVMLKAPFTGAPVEIFKTEQRSGGMQWFEKGGLAIVSDTEPVKRVRRSFLINVDDRSVPARQLWSRDSRDRYNDPGSPISRALPTGNRAILMSGDCIYLEGAGSSPEGDRPFLDRFDLKTLKAERLFRSSATSYESVVALLDDGAKRFITRYESPTEPPNYFIREGEQKKAITTFKDNTPQLRGITKQLVKYKRADGVDLSFTLYLPPNYRQGTRLPTVVWAYPYEYEDPATAGQVAGSTQRFTTISGYSELFFLLAGYAVLDNTAMPIVGANAKMNDTFVEQLVADAKAAIDKAVEMGVTDPDRVGVGGHSYGAFMTANLLAHSRLFRAGIAESGAHNRTLTPFGFQSERRTLWEAPDTYLKMSPFMYADKIKDALLLIHGEADDNSGTFPIQSDRMYQAVRGNKGIVRLVTLPYEAHGYAAKETIEHVLYEKITWFDKYVKNAPPRTEKTIGSN
jgi:dipeptidyl aminopeptidase/acylaminoacyl peptidase